VADVKVKFLGDITQLSRSIGTIKTQSQGIGGGFGRATTALKGMALPALAVATGIYTLAQRAGDTADALFDMHDQTGVSTDKLQEMRFVADQAGVSQDFYANSVKEVIKAQDELQRGTGPAFVALEDLGVAVSNMDGSMRSAEAITDDVFKALSKIEDPTRRAAAAQDIFKRKFEDVLPVLGLGEEALDDMRTAAHELGAVQSGEALTDANDYRQAMEELQTQIQDLVNQGMQVLIPWITNVLIPAFEFLIGTLDRVEQGWGNLMDKIFGKMDDFPKVKQSIGEINIELGKTPELGRIAGGGIRAGWEEARGAVKSYADEVRKATDPAFALKDAQDEFVAASKRVDDARKGTPEHTQALIDEQEAQADLNYATEQFEAAGQTAIDYLFDLGFQAGQARLEIQGVIDTMLNFEQIDLPPIMISAQTDLSDLFSGTGGRDAARAIEQELGIIRGGRRAPGVPD